MGLENTNCRIYLRKLGMLIITQTLKNGQLQSHWEIYKTDAFKIARKEMRFADLRIHSVLEGI